MLKSSRHRSFAASRSLTASLVTASIGLACSLPAYALQGAPPPPPNGEREGQRGNGQRGDGQREDGPRGEGRGNRGFGGPRGMMGGPGGGFMRRFADGFRPEFMRRDLPIIRDQLALDEAQLVVVETLLVDYDEAFSPASQTAQDSLREAMQEVAAGFFNPAMRERMDQAMQAVRADLEQIAAESGGEVDPEVRRQLFRDRMGKFQEEMVQEREASGAQAQMKETIGRMLDTIEAWHTKRTQMRDELLTGLRATLAEPQLGKWEAFDRYMRRERTLPLGALSGEQVNLFLVVDEAGLTPEVMTSLTPILDRYETELDAALRARNQFLEKSEIRFLRAAQASNTREVEETAKRASELHKAVRDINDRFRVELVSALPEDARAKVERATLAAGYERIYRPTQAERAFVTALEFEEISPEVRAAVENLQKQFSAEVVSLNERMMTHLRKQEPIDLVDQSSAIVSMVNGLPPMGPGGLGRRFGPGGEGDPMQEMLSKRGDLSDAYMRRLRDLLTPEQQEKLPQRGGRGRGGEFPGGPGGMGGMMGSGKISDMPEGIREQVKQYDTNKDGIIDDTERDAAIAGLRRQFGGGRGEGGGRAAPTQ